MEQTVWPKVDTSEYKVYKIDADKSASVLSAYGVTTIPTVIKGKESDGKFKEEKRKVGSMNVEETKNFLSGA